MIRISPVRLIDQDNKIVGVVETFDALKMAREVGLDLVEISADERPPLCKITDYGKYKYDLSKKEGKNRSAGKASEIKEVRLGRSVKIDPHDVGIRVAQARKFLMEGHKVLVVQRFRGREMMHSGQGLERLREIADALGDVAKVETPPRTAMRAMTMVLSPDRPKIEAIKRKMDAEKAKAGAAGATTGAPAVVTPAPEAQATEAAPAPAAETKQAAPKPTKKKAEVAEAATRR